MNIRRKNRLWIACAVLAGLALTIGLVLYALRSNIDLFYTPGEILYGKRETQQMPEVGQRLRVGGMVMPGSVQRDPNSLKVTFTIYDAEGSVDVSYEGILPDRSGDSALLRLIISREIATALSTCMCLRRSGRWAFMHQWQWQRLLALSGR